MLFWHNKQHESTTLRINHLRINPAIKGEKRKKLKRKHKVFQLIFEREKICPLTTVVCTPLIHVFHVYLSKVFIFSFQSHNTFRDINLIKLNYRVKVK